MEFLLKIVEGPMKGAEIALVEGVAVSFGSGEDCDIIVQDATVPAKACEFEVDASGVRMAVGGGSSEPLPSFEMRSFGTTSFAVGPVDGEWQKLIKPVRPALERADPEAGSESATRRGASGTASAPRGEGAGADTVLDAPSRRSADTAGLESATRRGASGTVLAVAVFLLLLVAIAVLAWFFWPKIAEKCPKAESARVLCVEKGKAWYAASTAWMSEKVGGEAKESERPTVPVQSLSDIAAAHNLHLHLSPSPVLQGNLKRRTERLAIRALALAADPMVKLELTDDETLFAAASELVFACSDGALKVESASNRVVTLSGYSPSVVALEKSIRALNADVKGIERLDTKKVVVGGPAPAPVAKTPYVQEKLPGEHPVVAIPAHTPEPPAKPSAREYPIAGILTAPYPCVVLRDGQRLLEGSVIGSAVLIKIEAERLTFRDGTTTFEWCP